jgi:serine/threonine protein kinase
VGKQDSKRSHVLFISYSNENQGIAEAICGAFEADNIPCWIAPRDVHGGRPYPGQITQAIREARILLLILTEAANRSKHVLREVERAAHCQNYLLTFRIEPVAPGDDLAYFLGADQWVDGFRPMPPARHFAVLIRHARRLLQNDPTEAEVGEDADASAFGNFAHFQILRRPDSSLWRLGKGGMGVTYKAIDTVLNRPVALKVIATELLRSPQARTRFLREAQAAALVHHPHVATIHHFGEEGDVYFYAMEFVEGEDLERYVGRGGPLAPATALSIVLQVAQALEAAQARNLIHRDIKPANIMAMANRAGNLDVKLIDFGLAKGLGGESLDAARVTRSQDFVGSPAFASPEQCETKKLDIRSDIYSLGVTLWYLLTSKRPFSGSLGEVMVAQIIKPPPFEQLSQTPEPVVALLRRMLEKKPEDRFQTPEELQKAVEKAAAELSGRFGAVAERIAVEPVRYGKGASPSEEREQPNVIAMPDSPLSGAYLALEVGALVDDRYKLVAEEREGNAGRLFIGRDEQEGPGQPSELGIKLIHPAIGSDPELLDLLENELGLIRQAVHPHLVRYYRLERGAFGAYLVREWVHGFLLYDLLRWRRSLNSLEILSLLGPLAATLDFVASQGMGLVDVSIHKILLECPKEIRQFEGLAKGDPQEWNLCTLRLNPLSLAPLLFRSRNDWDLRTVVPASRVLSMTQAGAGIRGTRAVQLYGRLVYELLNGQPPARSGDYAQKYTPLPDLDQSGNEILRRAFVAHASPGAYKSCGEFWKELKGNLATSRRPPGPVRPSPPPLAPTPKRSFMLITGAIVTGALIICLAIFGAIRFGTPVTSPTPSVAVVTPSPSFTPSPSLAVITPSPPLALITPSATAVVQPTVTPRPPTPSPAASIPEPTPTAPAGPNVIANAIYIGTIRAKNDSPTNVPLRITIGSDLKSGTMTQSGHHGDLVVKFTGVWDASTLHAVTEEVISQPNGIQWEPESFTLHFGEDGKSATYECVADGKTYVANLSPQSAAVTKVAQFYKGTIRKRGETGSGTPLTINLAIDRDSGTMTQNSKSGDTVVRFNGVWDGDRLRAVTNEVLSKPANIQWKPESFTLHFAEDGKSGSYECNSEGHLYEAELFQP